MSSDRYRGKEKRFAAPNENASPTYPVSPLRSFTLSLPPSLTILPFLARAKLPLGLPLRHFSLLRRLPPSVRVFLFLFFLKWLRKWNSYRGFHNRSMSGIDLDRWLLLNSRIYILFLNLMKYLNFISAPRVAIWYSGCYTIVQFNFLTWI